MATQAERRAQTRQKLIDAAKALFEQYGFDTVTVEQIVKAANVAKGTFYQYYETKIDVLADVVRDEGASKTKQALQEVEQGASALAMLERFIKVQCGWFESHANLAEALIMSALKTVGDEEVQDQHRYSRNFQTALMKLAQQQGEVRNDIEACEIAKVIGGAMVVTALAWSKKPQPNVLFPSMQTSLEIILSGVRTDKGN